MLASLKSSVKAGINVKINIIIGFPEETHRDVWLTIWYLIRFSFAGGHDTAIGVFAPYPGSELYDELLKKKIIKNDEVYWDTLSYVDISETVSYCENISARWLLFYNWLGMFVFYSSNYLFRPMRFFRTVKNIITNNSLM